MDVFNRRAHVMHAVPMVFRGAFRSALRLAVQEKIDGARSEDLVRFSSLARRVRFKKGRKPRRSCPAEGEKKKGGHVLELSGEGGRARLVVLAAEVGGRWSVETAQFLSGLARAKAQSAPLLLQGRVEAAWLRRWSATLACSAARSFAVSLLDRRPVPGTGDAIPSTHEVMRDDRFA